MRDLITMRHIGKLAKVMLATGNVVFYGYLMELFLGYFTGNKYESYMTTQPYVRRIRLDILDAAFLQWRYHADTLGEETAHQYRVAVFHLGFGQHRYVVRAFRDYRGEFAPRVFAIRLGAL